MFEGREYKQRGGYRDNTGEARMWLEQGRRLIRQ